MVSKLFVGGLPYSFSSDDLKELFAEYGTVESASVITDRDSGQSKGFGFVEMSTQEESQAAIDALNNQEVGGRRIVVNTARPQEKRPDRGGNNDFRKRY